MLTIFTAFILASLAHVSYAASTDVWPEPGSNHLMGSHAMPWLTDSSNTAICKESLSLAKKAYLSKTVELSIPPEDTKGLGFHLVLQPINHDNQAELKADTVFFEKISKESNLGKSAGNAFWYFSTEGYWQSMKQSGRHLAAGVANQNWRSNDYSIFAVPDGTSFKQFVAGLNPHGLGPGTGISALPDAIFSYEPLWILRDDHSGEMWVIDPGSYYGTWEDWTVYGLKSGGLKKECLVRFSVNTKKDSSYIPYPANHILPSSVRSLAALLDSTLGSGENDGELRSTSILRSNVYYTWENLALRPWALNSVPYNTTEEVNYGLGEWAVGNARYHAIYNAIQKQYPQARTALAIYYRRAFGLSPKHSNVMASYALDIAYRTYFLFHSESRQAGLDNANSIPNPWIN